MGMILFAFAGVQAADEVKIGLVDFQKVLDDSIAGKRAQEEINRKGEAMEAELRKVGEEIEEIKNQLEREALVMSAEAREEKEREIRIKVGDFKAMQNRHLQDFKEAERELVAQIQKEVVELVKKMGAQEGYSLILERRECGAVYFPDSMDLTDRVIEAYDKTTAAGKQ